MKPTFEIRLIEREQLESIIPLLKMLNTSIDDVTLNSRLQEMKANAYQCVGIYDGSGLIGICGFWILVKHYVGKHIEPDNVFILPEYQGQKLGEQMMNWIYDYGRSCGCVASELNCYVSNSSGIRFWINQGYKIIGYHFQKMF